MLRTGHGVPPHRLGPSIEGQAVLKRPLGCGTCMGKQATRVGRRAEERDVPEDWGGQGRLHGGGDGLRDALYVRVRVRGGHPRGI